MNIFLYAVFLALFQVSKKRENVIANCSASKVNLMEHICCQQDNLSLASYHFLFRQHATFASLERNGYFRET
jgi:hypothetical protein